ncbi:MAG: glycosidase [Candidatus Bathyarchaeota archaeon]|nr:glycosidase [Candidatus Bathyarchaeota archaeon]
MERFAGNPILKPIEAHAWESREVFNAAAVYLEGKVHLLYRAIGNDGISRLGYANSKDGFTIDERLPQPVFEPAFESEKDGVEDPRLSLIDKKLVMTYTALCEFKHLQSYQVALTDISVEDFIQKRWNWGTRRLPFSGIRNKNAVVFPEKIGGRYVMFHRIEPDLCVAYSEDLEKWCDVMCVMKPRVVGWDNWKIGVAGTPIKTSEGWLVVYHGVSVEKMYSLGLALLDLEHPERVLYRSKTPILVPVADYERFGKVPNVVFSCGNVVIGDRFFLYYGGADSVLCVASINFNELLALVHK